MVKEATIEKLKGKNITINNSDVPKDTLGSSASGIALQQISDRLKAQTQEIEDESADIAGASEENKPDVEKGEEITINNEKKSAGEYENMPADEFIQLVLERSVPNLSELDGRSAKRMKGFVSDLAEKLNGINTENSGEVDKIFRDAIKDEAAKTKLGEFLEENFDGWDGEFGDEQEVSGASSGDAGTIDQIEDRITDKKDDPDQQHIEEALEKISKAGAEKVENKEKGLDEANASSDDDSNEKGQDSESASAEKKGALIKEEKTGAEKEPGEVEYPKNPSEFLKKIGSVYFVSKEDISDMKVLSYNPKTHLVKVEFGQRFIEHAPESDEEGKEIPTYSIASKNRIEDIDYERFIDLIENDYVTDEDQLKERVDETEKDTRAKEIENISAKYTNDKGDVLVVMEYKPGEKSKKGYTRKKGVFQVQINDGKVESVPAGKLEQLIKDDGYVEELAPEGGPKKKLKEKKKERKEAEIQQSLDDAEKELGEKGTEYLYDGSKVLVGGYELAKDGGVEITLVPEDGKGGSKVPFDRSKELIKEGRLKKVEIEESPVEEEQEMQERISEELQMEFGKKGTKYIWTINEKPIKVEIAGFFVEAGSLGKVGFRMKGSDKIHQFHVADVRAQMKKNFLSREGSDEKEIAKEEKIPEPQNVEQTNDEENGAELSEKEKRLLEAYKKYARVYLQEVEKYDYEGDGYLKKSIPGEKKRQTERFWEVVLPGKLRKVFEEDEMIERAIEQIKKPEK